MGLMAAKNRSHYVYVSFILLQFMRVAYLLESGRLDMLTYFSSFQALKRVVQL